MLGTSHAMSGAAVGAAKVCRLCEVEKPLTEFGDRTFEEWVEGVLSRVGA